MKKLFLCFAIALFMLPIAVMGQCGTSNLTADDGTNTYQTAPIGPHCWTTTNFRATNYYDGTEIPNTLIYKSDMYPDEAENLDNYGYLYTWYAAMKVAEGTTTPVIPGEHGFVQGICPDGWHLPSDVEVAQLSNYDVMAIHSENPIHWLIPGTNETGHNMLPGGFYHSSNNRFENLRGESYIWTSSSLSPMAPKVIWSDCYCNMFVIKDAVAVDAMSVRCVCDIYQAQVVTDAWSVEKVDDNYVFYYNGNVTFAGYDDDFVLGFQYGTDPADLSGDWNEAATTEGPFRTTIENLIPGMTYYYRAYVTNDFGTVYGMLRSFTAPELPTVTTTSPVADITSSSATANGKVTGEYVLTSGICWNTTGTPTIEDSKTTDGPEGIALTNADITAALSDLTLVTTYYVRAYATNALGTSYGEVVSFTTLPELPTVITADVTDITSTTATTGGEVTDDGGGVITARGICWGTDPELTIANDHTTDGTGAGSFTSIMSGLDVNTTYYVCAYATNAGGTSYGEVVSFTTLPGLPTVITADVTNIASTTAMTGGEVTNDGGSAVTARGICWGTDPELTIANDHTIDGTGTGTFTSTMSGLDMNTTYYVRAYATNAIGTAYGEVLEFTTLSELPTVVTAEPFDILLTTASAGGEVTDDGGASITARGICWGTDFELTTDNDHTTDGTGTGSFTSAMSGLEMNTTYYVCAYATNAAGTAYGEVLEFTTFDDLACPDLLTVSDADGNSYRTVKIGNQCWMRENLRTKAGLSSTSYRHVKNSSSYDASCGLLYTWTAVMNGAASSITNPSNVQGICPTGWHVPSNAEWTEMTTYLANNGYACSTGSTALAKAIATTWGWTSSTITCAVGNSPSANNASGFSAFPAGSYTASTGVIGNYNTYAYFWTATQTEGDATKATYRFINKEMPSIGTGNLSVNNGYSLRCVLDAEPVYQPCDVPTVSDVDGHVYPTVKIGTQCWMKENLRTTTHAYGNIYHPFENATYDVEYGVLYDWAAMMNGASSSTANPSGVQGICPAGWHVPSSDEWETLKNYVKSQSDYQCNATANNIAKALAANSKWNASGTACAVGNDLTANDATGFSAVPSSCYATDNASSIRSLGYFARFWTSSQYSTTDANYYFLSNSNATLQNNHCGKGFGQSVRCVKDAEPETFTCGTSTVSDVDGNSYNTVKIGDQCWTKENLRTSTTTGNTYHANNNASNDETYGLLYDWAAVMQGATSSTTNPSGVQGICPTGWHVPSSVEWTQLTDYVTSQSEYLCDPIPTIVWALASPMGWNSTTVPCSPGNNPSVNNATGFSVVPAGLYNESCIDFGYSAFLWAASQTDIGMAYSLYMGYSNLAVSTFSADMNRGYSVRCLRDAADGSELGENESNDTQEEPAAELSVTTDSANAITSNTATLYGNVTDLGGNTSVNAGFKYGTSETAMNTKADDAVSATGLYSIDITGLTANTTYYFKAYAATNATDTVYGEVKSFTTEEPAATFNCGDSIADVDGNKYATVAIGTQCWTAQNLRTTTGLTESNDYWHANSQATNDKTYGLLYTWNAATGGEAATAIDSKVQGICPEGWHIPTNAQWDILTTFVNTQTQYQCEGNDNIAKALSSTTGWANNSTSCAVGNNKASNNTTGFNVVPASLYNYTSGSTSNFSFYAYIWSATASSSGTAAGYRQWAYNKTTVLGTGTNYNKNYGFSVRCLYNEALPTPPAPESEMSVTTDSARTSNTIHQITLYGTVNNLGDNASISAGFKYGTNETAMNSAIATTITATGLYHLDLADISANTTYYYKSFVAIDNDTVWGAVNNFTTSIMATLTCGDSISDSQGNHYATVAIGTQCWMAQNLRATTSLTENTNYWHAGNNSNNDVTYGLLYNWNAATGGTAATAADSKIQGICPNGWHIPTNAEWTTLTTFVKSQVVYHCDNSESKFAWSLASTTDWSFSSNICAVGNNQSNNNATGFNAFPAGYYNGSPSGMGNRTIFWSSTNYTSGTEYAYVRPLINSQSAMSSDYNGKDMGCSVRCLRD